MSVSGIKTVVATPAAIFAGASALAGRTFMSVRNMDTCVNIKVGGRTLEPGQEIQFKFAAATAQTVNAYSNGRAVEVEVVEA